MNYSTSLQGKPVQLDYLDYLIDDCNREREQSEFIKFQDETTADITYLTPLKDFTGYLRGYYEMLSRKKYKISENKAIRSNCRNYLKIVRDKNDRIIQTETYRKGKIDCIHQCREINNRLYFFPFSSSGTFYPTYTYVTSQADASDITEEYMVEGCRIIYYSYRKKPDSNGVELYRINYVKGGSCPINDEEKGIITTDTLEYTCEYCDCWLYHCDESTDN